MKLLFAALVVLFGGLAHGRLDGRTVVPNNRAVPDARHADRSGCGAEGGTHRLDRVNMGCGTSTPRPALRSRLSS